MMNREKVIQIYDIYTEIGYFETGKFIRHSFDDEPAIICNDGTKFWYKDGKKHRDNNLPAVICDDNDGAYSGYKEYYKNGKQYWIINNKEYYDVDEIKEKFKNNILKFKEGNINTKLLKENNIDAIWITWSYYIIPDQSQYNLTLLKFL